MRFVFDVTQRVFHELVIEAPDFLSACDIVQDMIEAGEFGEETASEIDFDLNHDATYYYGE